MLPPEFTRGSNKPDDEAIAMRARFRAASEGSVQYDPSPLRFNNMTLVGGLADATGQDLCANDRDYSRHTFRTMAKLGLGLQPDFDVHVRNMNYGPHHNFLKNPVKSDVLVIPFVLQPPKNCNEKLSNKGVFEHDPDGADRAQWANAIRVSNPRLVVVFAGASGNEVLPCDLEQSAYVWPRNLCPGLDDRSGLLFRRDFAKRLVAQKPHGLLAHELNGVL